VLDANDTHQMNTNGWCVRVRKARLQPARFLLMLHGYTGDENSMWVFARNLPKNLFIAAPRAPYPAKEGGFSWRNPEPGSEGSHTLTELKSSAEDLIGLIDSISESVGLDATQLDMAGFSQGAAMAAVLALSFPQRFGKVALLAGFLPAGVEDLIEARVLKDKPLFVAHGTQDQLVPVERARQLIESLEKAGAHVTFCEAEVGHKVSADCLRGLEGFFAAS